MWFAIGLAWLAGLVIAAPLLAAVWQDNKRGWFDGEEREKNEMVW